MKLGEPRLLEEAVDVVAFISMIIILDGARMALEEADTHAWAGAESAESILFMGAIDDIVFSRHFEPWLASPD